MQKNHEMKRNISCSNGGQLFQLVTNDKKAPVNKLILPTIILLIPSCT